jgi:hypothetical protein
MSPPVDKALRQADANELVVIARRVERLTVSRTRPEQFHIDKSQLAFELRMIAARVDRRRA